ncbi:hypothetical protein [uncultured Aquimarina sp.]|uniref:hypothetical protein n=1 Tax=uncultured Aquimarina sp. TaxID=575652 RepID=UPI0026383799|nr:hypothetical protein [uncultured Aquimarina sp.]
MKTTLKLSIVCTAIFAAMTFTSCEKDEIQAENTVSEDLDTSSDILGKASAISAVSRYYSGGSNTVHTYRVLNLGIGIGTYEGRPFKLGTYDFNQAAPSGTKQLFLLLSPGNRDFVMTTSGAEKFNLLRRGWRDYSVRTLYGNIQKAAYIHNSGGSGRVKLYRFYGSSNTDHLYTTNYNEGVSAGYAYEGVIGYVYR